MSVIQTGIFASAEDKEEARKRFKEAADTPVVKVHGVWLNDQAVESAKTWLDELAVKYRLPPLGKDEDGDVIHYGMSNEGEFTGWKP